MIILRKKAAPVTTPSLIPNISFQFVNLNVNAGSVANVTNGSGLTPATPALTGTHESYTTSNGVQSTFHNNIWPRILLFTLPSVYWVSAMSFWQVTGVSNGFGIRDFTLEYSLDNSGWTQIPGSPTTFAQGSSSFSPLQVSWNPVRAAYIRFLVTNTWGGNRIALSEVQFAGYL
ncbi:T9SS C-terminal target domain-containing protein [uncultured phage]|nr:T9SS C-terminal target domain-containing protein [uncultured phage]